MQRFSNYRAACLGLTPVEDDPISLEVLTDRSNSQLLEHVHVDGLAHQGRDRPKPLSLGLKPFVSHGGSTGFEVALEGLGELFEPS